MEKTQKDYSGMDLNKQIDIITSEIAAIQENIDLSVSKSKDLMKRIYEQNGKINEYAAILRSFDTLREQYKIDVARLSFVLEGAEYCNDSETLAQCPICHSTLGKQTHPAIHQAVRADLSHSALHLQELELAYADTKSKRNEAITIVNRLETERSSVDDYIEHTLSPQLKEMQTLLNDYRLSIQHEQELQTIRQEKALHEASLYEWEPRNE